MNINSISELQELTASTLNATSKQELTSVSKKYHDAQTITGGPDLSNLNELGFNTLSCKSMSVEVSYTSEDGRIGQHILTQADLQERMQMICMFLTLETSEPERKL